MQKEKKYKQQQRVRGEIDEGVFILSRIIWILIRKKVFLEMEFHGYSVKIRYVDDICRFVENKVVDIVYKKNN